MVAIPNMTGGGQIVTGIVALGGRALLPMLGPTELTTHM